MATTVPLKFSRFVVLQIGTLKIREFGQAMNMSSSAEVGLLAVVRQSVDWTFVWTF